MRLSALGSGLSSVTRSAAPHRIDSRRSARRHVGCHDGDAGQNQADGHHRQRIACADAEEQTRHQPGQADRAGDADGEPDERQTYAAVQDQPQQASFASRPAPRECRSHASAAPRCRRSRRRCRGLRAPAPRSPKRTEQHRYETTSAHRLILDLIHRANIADRLVLVDAANRRGDGCLQRSEGSRWRERSGPGRRPGSARSTRRRRRSGRRSGPPIFSSPMTPTTSHEMSSPSSVLPGMIF